MSAHILVVEDDARLGQLLVEFLQAHGMEAELEGDGLRAVHRILTQPPDVAVIDWMLPGCDGLEVCRRVRESFVGPLLMLTARRSDFDQVVGLEVGADDYITKPVEPRVLLARIRSQLRLRERLALGGAEPAAPLLTSHRLGGLVLDPSTRLVTVQGTPLVLTSAEFDLLAFLLQRAGEIVTREELYQALRGITYDGLDRSMDIHISRIRRKLREAGLDAELIQSIRGAGYFMPARA